MKERVTGTLFLIKTYILAFFILALIVPAHAQNDNKKIIEKLPAFSYHTMDGQPFTNNNLKQNSKLMIVYFNPLCEVCQKEMKDIMADIDYFKNIQLVLISPNSKEEIMQFINTYELNKYNQITILHDMNDVFYKEFHAIGYPSLYLYDEAGVLIEHFDTQADMKEIKSAFGDVTAKK